MNSVLSFLIIFIIGCGLGGEQDLEEILEDKRESASQKQQQQQQSIVKLRELSVQKTTEVKELKSKFKSEAELAKKQLKKEIVKKTKEVLPTVEEEVEVPIAEDEKLAELVEEAVEQDIEIKEVEQAVEQPTTPPKKNTELKDKVKEIVSAEEKEETTKEEVLADILFDDSEEIIEEEAVGESKELVSEELVEEFVEVAEESLLEETTLPEQVEEVTLPELSAEDLEEMIEDLPEIVEKALEKFIEENLQSEPKCEPTTPIIANSGRRVSETTEVVDVSISDPCKDYLQARGGQYEDWANVSKNFEFELNSGWNTLELRVSTDEVTTDTVSWLIYQGEQTLLQSDTFEDIIPEAYSPYLFTTDVKENSTGNVFLSNVEIEAGVEINIGKLVNLWLNDEIKINGSEDKRVTIKANPLGEKDKAEFKGALFFYNTESTISDISYVDIEGFAGVAVGNASNGHYNIKNATLEAMVNMNTFGDVVMEDSEIRCKNSWGTGLYFAADRPSFFTGDRLSIEGCRYGLRVSNDYTITLRDSIISAVYDVLISDANENEHTFVNNR